MTVGEWLHARSPKPPPALAARLDAALESALAEPLERAPALFLDAGERIAARLMRDETSRASALDLLAADALVTYAFEAAGEQSADACALASAAMDRIATLATASTTSEEQQVQALRFAHGDKTSGA
ncbi:MAG: hypothetical protein V4550_21570 [Gemmatimonadota bacterium]